MNTFESNMPSLGAASDRSLDLETWLDTALADTFPASDPVATYRSDDAIVVREARETAGASRSDEDESKL